MGKISSKMKERLGCLYIVVGIPLVFLCAALLPFLGLLGKKKVSDFRTPGGLRFQISRKADPEGLPGDDYSLRISDSKSERRDWSSIGRSEKTMSFVFFASDDERFVCVAREDWDGRFPYGSNDRYQHRILIYDSEDDFLWPADLDATRRGSNNDRFWKGAMDQALQANPEILKEGKD